MAQIGLGRMPLMGVWAAGRGHAFCTRFLGLQKPWGEPPPSPGGPEASYGYIRQPETEANHPLPSWHLVRAYSDLLPERKHIYGALSVCPALWQPLYVLSQGGGCYPYCADEEIEAQRCYVTGLGHVHHMAEPGCQHRTV